jgi:hypothetical protein
LQECIDVTPHLLTIYSRCGWHAGNIHKYGYPEFIEYSGAGINENKSDSQTVA